MRFVNYLSLAAAAMALTVLVALAVAAAIRIWSEGSLFDGWRSATQAWRDLRRDDGRRTARALLGDLLNCRLCLSVHVTGILVLATVVPALWWPAAAPWFLLPVVGLAAIELAGKVY